MAFAEQIEDAAVRLIGADADVIAVAREAVQTVWSRQDLRRELFRPLAGLHSARRRLNAPRSAVNVRRDEVLGRSSSLWRVVWGVLLTLCLVATTASLAMMGPPGRKNRWIEPDQAMQIAMPALVVALVAGIVLLLVPPPRQGAASVSTTVTVVVSILLALLRGYRAVVGASDRRTFSAAQVQSWLIGAGVLLIVLAWRLNRQRCRENAVPGTPCA